MQIVLHVGAHSTDEDRLLKGLLRNCDLLAPRGIHVPGPSRYRRLLRETLLAMTTGAPAPDSRDVLLESILEGDGCERLVLSNESFACMPHRVFDDGVFYRLMGRRLANFLQVFGDDEIEIHMSMRNPATFVPAVFSKVKNQDFAEFMQGARPFDICWADLVARMLEAAPRARLTLWCNEDTPLIWRDVLHALAGVPASEPMAGETDLLSEIMTAEGYRRMCAFLEAYPPRTESRRQRIVAAFLERSALDEEMEQEIDLPGWSEGLVTELTELYDADVAEIAEMPGVRLIQP